MPAAEISIPVIKKRSKDHDNEFYFIVREIDKDININLKDWFIQIVPPDDDGDDDFRGSDEWRMVLKPRADFLRKRDREHAELPREL